MSVEKPDRFDIDVALRNREFEIQLFWQRANYFLVLVTALGVAAFSAKNDFVGLVISFFAVIVCWFWFRTNLGSRFWQVFWESEVERLAPKYKLESFTFEWAQIREHVSKTFNTKTHWWRRMIDAEVLQKPSVTMHMISLSIAALAFWSVMFLYFVSRNVFPAGTVAPTVPAPGALSSGVVPQAAKPPASTSPPPPLPVLPDKLPASTTLSPDRPPSPAR